VAQGAKYAKAFVPEQFSIATHLRPDMLAHDSSSSYWVRLGSMSARLSPKSPLLQLFLDAPFTFQLVYKTPKKSLEAISTVGFSIDFDTRLLRIDYNLKALGIKV
jgi:hypothetical protein